MIDREMVKIGCAMGLLAMLTQGVKYLREHSGEVFDKRKFVVWILGELRRAIGPLRFALHERGALSLGFRRDHGWILWWLYPGCPSGRDLGMCPRLFQRSGKNGQA